MIIEQLMALKVPVTVTRFVFIIYDQYCSFIEMLQLKRGSH